VSDVIVVGGGPAGACLALLLGRQGIDVELLEQARVPRDKPCGEGLLPPGVEILRAAGLAEAVGGETLTGVRYHVGNGSLRAGFAPAARGVGQKRMVLDAALWNAAARTSHVRAMDGARIDAPLVERGRVTGVIVDGDVRRARWVVAADGSSSTLRRELGMERTVRRRRVGARAHFRLARREPFHDIQIFMRSGYELYVTPLPRGEVLVAALAFQDAVRNGLRSSFRCWIEREPLLRTWLDGATQTSELAGRAPLVKHVGARSPAGLVFLGDAATSVDPVTAGGLSLALSSAALLSTALPAALAGDGTALPRFERSRARAVRVHRWLGAGLLALAERPRVAEWTRRQLRTRPSALDALVGLVAWGSPR
jgi:2-polyprenyl-6-methoxyphenol hydroxylase-like FAD-dependent oxidoreductase